MPTAPLPLVSMNAERPTLAVSTDWWEAPYRRRDAAGDLWFSGLRVSDLAARCNTPAYFYSEERVRANIARLRTTLGTLEQPVRLLYAMKSNRHMPLLHLMRDQGVGLDVCSPGEIELALACGFREDELSFTAGSLSSDDYRFLGAHPGVWVNADSLTALRRIAAVSPGRDVGLRINPASGVGYSSNELVRYSGAKATKFGVYLDRFEEALELARSLGLRLTTLHCHSGCGFLTPQLGALDEVFARVEAFLSRAEGITQLNLGGGLGIPLVASDAPLDLNAWASLVRKHLAAYPSLRLVLEPGDYLVKDAGLLVTEVTQIEEKGGTVFVGVDAGFNVHPEPAFYKLPLQPVPALTRAGGRSRVTIVGNVNEALDVWNSDVELPPLVEGDKLCFLNAGGYGASMASHHCLRTRMEEHWIPAPGDKAEPEAPSPAELNEANKIAWDSLYASVPDLVWGRVPLPFLEEHRDAFVAGLGSPGRLLDAGTGEGRNLPFLLACGADEVHALDASANALAKLTPAVARRVHTHLADLGTTGYPDGHFDGVLLLDVVETLPDPGQVLREMRRILRPGGLLLCNIPGMDDGVAGIDMRPIGQDVFLYRDRYYFQFWQPERAASLASEAGLEVVSSGPRAWDEGAHPGFRYEDHRHLSHVFLLRRRD